MTNSKKLATLSIDGLARRGTPVSPDNDVDDLGPLPHADRYSVRQRNSIIALQGALPADKFIFRDERADVAGVDGSLELRIRSSYWNLERCANCSPEGNA